MAGAPARGLSAWPPKSANTDAAESSFFTGFISTNTVQIALYFRLFFHCFRTFVFAGMKIIHQNTMLQLICMYISNVFLYFYMKSNKTNRKPLLLGEVAADWPEIIPSGFHRDSMAQVVGIGDSSET